MTYVPPDDPPAWLSFWRCWPCQRGELTLLPAPFFVRLECSINEKERE